MNYAVPKEFKLLLIIPKQSPTTNFTREDENRLFADYATSPKEIGIICTSTLMGVIPGLITRDYTTFVKNLMQISHLGTKKVELELNRSWIFHVQEILNKFIDFRYQRNKETDFSLSNDNGNTLSELLKGTDEIVLKRPIPWLGLSSLGPTLYSFIDSRIYDTVSLQKEIKQIINDDSKVLITEVNNDKALIQRIES
ncbi:hypothetical protein HYX17_00505 [Candidatus Woesearchaeota archaeon]|nr:hypothetical protein [Candidatus Woesearchaeota archaeon]